MKKNNTLLLALGLILLSVLLHFVHVLIFKDVHHMLIYLWGDIAFIPLEVFFVSLVLDKFIERREKEQLRSKANMLVGLFYQEVGGRLLGALAPYDRNLDKNRMEIEATWPEEKYEELRAYLATQQLSLDLKEADYTLFHDIIDEKQSLIMNLLTNQALQENEHFTESLMSVFHLLEELKQRAGREWGEEDISHLKVDTERVYRNLAREWVQYLVYLKKVYPYLYASAVRTNPFGG